MQESMMEVDLALGLHDRSIDIQDPRLTRTYRSSGMAL